MRRSCACGTGGRPERIRSTYTEHRVTLSSFLQYVRRGIAKFVDAASVAHLSVIVFAFAALRIFVALRDGIVMEGDNAPQAGAALGQVWAGELSFDELLTGPTGEFFRQRTSQLLYPLLISFHALVGLDIATHLLVLNTFLGVTLIAASYLVGVRLHGKGYALLVVLLMCSLTGPYWVARFAVVDNAFYALIPLAALSVLNWDRQRSATSVAWMALGLGSLMLTRPEAFLIVISIAGVFTWIRVRHTLSRRTLLTALMLGLAVGTIGTIGLIRSSPSLQRTLLSRAHVAWGLAGSSHTLLNRGGAEFDVLLARNVSWEIDDPDDMHYRMSMDAIATIRNQPLWYVVKIPLRGLAITFAWVYQPWSWPHIAYEALYTIFIVTGLGLLIGRGQLSVSHVVLLAFPLAIWLFLSAYLIDNDLKHRNGMLVALNLIAPAGYVVARRGRSISRG